MQTLWPALFARAGPGSPVAWRRQRWDTPDGDFIDVDWLADAEPPPGRPKAASAPLGGSALCEAGSVGAPILVLFHGLEGSSRSHYAQAFAAWAHANGLDFAVPHFRGCSGELNRTPRAYHSGDWAEIDWLLQHFGALARARGVPLLAVGISLGGNALLRWAGELGMAARARADAVAAVCAPLDLAAGAQALGAGFNRWVYTPMFLRTMQRKARAKAAQFPGLFDARRLAAVRDVPSFDELFTAPLHGFAGAADYYRRAAAGPLLPAIRLPALALNALNDPFVPAAALPDARHAGQVTLWRPAAGGHVGFAQGAVPPGDVCWLPRAVGGWLLQQVGWRHP